MAFSKKPTQPPPFDTPAFLRRLRDITAAADLGPFSVFNQEWMTNFHRWIRSEGDYDGIGLRDVVNANAYALDALKEDFDGHRVMDDARHAALVQRVAALEGQQSAPFPGSG